MDIGAAFSYVFEDDEWLVKLAIGSGVVFLFSLTSSILIGLVLIFPVMGYMVQTIKNVQDGYEPALPNWSTDQVGDLFVKGGSVFTISLVYNLPILLVFCCGGVVYGGIIAAAPDQAANFAGILSLSLVCLGSVAALLSGLLLPAGIIRYAQYDSIGSALQIGEVFSFITSNVGAYLLVIVVNLVVTFASFLVGLIACGIGIVVTTFYSYLVAAHLYGQLAQQAAVKEQYA